MNFFSKYSNSKTCLPIEKHYLFLDGIWNLIGTVEQNHSNQLINDENLKYQRERNAIEDARYEEETAYNRQFAEDERDYQRSLDEYQKQFAEENRDYERALQQKIFEREDTAIQRQAETLSSMGINPVSQQLNGLGSGQVISNSAPNFEGTTPGAALSSRGGNALHNDLKKQNVLSSMVQGMQGGLSSLISIANTMEGLQTGKYQRDALALENDAKFLQNLRTANSLGIKYDKLLLPKEYPTFLNLRKNDRKMTFFDDNEKDLYDKDYFKDSLGSQFKKDYLNSVPSWVGNLSALSDDNVYSKAEKALTKASDMFDNVTTKLGNESIYELGKMNNKFNLAQFLKSLLF